MVARVRNRTYSAQDAMMNRSTKSPSSPRPRKTRQLLAPLRRRAGAERAYLASRMIEKLAVCRVIRPFVTTKVSVPNLTLAAADSHAHSTYARSS